MSDISRFSTLGGPLSDKAASLAKDIARQEVGIKLQNGFLNYNDPRSIEREYQGIYRQEYYKCYAILLQQEHQPRVIYVQERSPAKKYTTRHAVARFSKLNCLIHVHRDCITVGRISYPIDEDISPDTMEAFLNIWPGPLDRPESSFSVGDQLRSKDENLKRKVTEYIETLLTFDPQRRIRYSNAINDDQRKTILKLLDQLITRNGSIGATEINKLLLRPEQIEIQDDERDRKPLDTLQKFLLLGKGSSAIRYAQNKKLWDHATCLKLLHEYKPPNPENVKDSILEYVEDIIKTLDPGILKTVYGSLLNRILKSDMKNPPNVGNNPYEFAILCANDCEIEFDQTNELFKLIIAIKKAIRNPAIASRHLISLGETTLDAHDLERYDDISMSIKQSETYFSRTSTISNIDMLILNEVWEYCLNLTISSLHYNYIINLVPYKLIFASRLLDFGLHEMFANYLTSIKNALNQARIQNFIEADPFYDWTTIEKSVEYLSGVWDIFLLNQDFSQTKYNIPPPSFNQHLIHEVVNHDFNPESDPISPQLEDRISYEPQIEDKNQYEPQPEYKNQYETLLQYTNPYEPQLEYKNQYESQQDYNDYSNEPSRRTSASKSMEMPAFSPPSFGMPGMTIADRNQKEMASSSPLSKSRDPVIGESFNSPCSPLNEYDDLPKQDLAGGSNSNTNSNNITTNNNNKSQPAGDQQSGFFTNLVGSAKALLPKSNSKQMILPEDSNKTIVFDEKKGSWVDTAQPEGADKNDTLDAPPMMNMSQPPAYSYGNKISKARYPKPQF